MRRIHVIGAGAIGLGIAWRAAQRGADVTVFDPDPGSGASTTAAGMLAAVTESHFGEETLADLATDSVTRWPSFAAELENASGLNVGYRDIPTLLVGIEEGDRDNVTRYAGLYRKLGFEVENLTGRTARKAEPLLSQRARGGVRVRADHEVDPRAVHAALLTAAHRAGVHIVRDKVTDPTAGDADVVILAAGCGSAAFDLPVRPVRGVVLRLRADQHQLQPDNIVRAFVRGNPVYIVPRANGEIVIGATSEERGFDATTGTAGATWDLLRNAIDVVPEIAEYHLAEVDVNFRPGTPDNLPILGWKDDLLVATGHYRQGIALLPATADHLAAAAFGETVDSLAPFDPARFADRHAGE
ncbi:glycine oxidase ThiO [Natronoglycomyces albus]|uniref:glycine oxidase n=1 Tax=Natronoglycomyces albus TaxID=2811108 RepID=A0A895XLZ8_9ACTN|nr:glycine oxidase ThiO [Natronoglycomyces albus]QSB06127.1 glycine oxidase ThiO [Natronoglycomyces albus]